MNSLLKIDWERKYKDYVRSLDFTDNSLKVDFLDLLGEKAALAREKMWGHILANRSDYSEIHKLSNPYYIGFGNPRSKVLIIGKEKGFDIGSRPDLFIKESVNNIIQWQYLNKYSKTYVSSSIVESLGYNPLFPKYDSKQKYGSRHTWVLYSQIIAGIYNLDWRELFNENTNLNNSFFNNCFTTEINHIPSKYSEGRKLINERKQLLKSDFFQKFPNVIIGAQGYLELEEITEIFGLTCSFKKKELGEIGKKRKRKIIAYVARSKSRTIIYCNQLSGSGGWSGNALNSLIKLLS